MCSLSRIIAFCIVFTPLAGCEWPGTESTGQTFARKHLPERFRVSGGSQLLLLPVQIQGKEYRFLLDTGVSATIFDKSLRPLLSQTDQSTIVHTPNGELRLNTYSPPAAKLGCLNLPTRSRVLCMDLGSFRARSKENFYGLLGMDFLGWYVFQIDFDRGEMTFLQSVSPDAGIRIPITFNNRVPQVRVTIPGLPEPEVFQVDTGLASMADGDLRAEVFDFLAERGKLKLVGTAKAQWLSGSGLMKVGRVGEMSLGGFQHKDLIFGRTAKVSFLGINYLSRYVVTFDCCNGAMYLREGRQFDRKRCQERMAWTLAQILSSEGVNKDGLPC